MTLPAQVYNLIERFERNRDAYRSGQYNETQLRREFIDPFFRALGWDVDNEQGYAEAYKDVVHEDALKIGGATKAPDYCFRIGGTRKFFLEAKKPSVNIKDDIHPAYQLRRYAWSAKLPLSILTDFEEFAVYDCRVKPDKADKSATARTLYLTYRDYAGRWDDIAAIFAREAVLKGSFDKYAESNKAKKGTAEVDAAFLQEIERWRDLLARNIALRNPGLSQRDLNTAVQATIDRIIFLRIGEDRGIEPYGRLMALQNGSQVYERLSQLFRQADDRYNSGLFHFKAEKGRAEPPDEWTLNLALDDKPLKDLLKNLYYPDSPYEFSVLPADILGQVYEQFLGKVIRLTGGHRAIVEDKPEVKKAGGVYYTPTYIVDYIVRQTVGRLVEDKTPKQVGAGGRMPLRILDPACGSGSFLIGAYQYLLAWYRDQYLADDPAKWAKGRQPRLYQGQGGEWYLTTTERKRILLDHIYGVDIDPQAVEVTKLSLLLKVLEGESGQGLATQLSFLQERALPDLSGNVKCGNSLIGPDFYDMQAQGQQTSFLALDDEERYRINVFDWQAEFPQIMCDGGFEVVIGNPPYVRSINLKESYPQEWVYYHSKYKTASFREWDIYLVFVEKALSLLKNSGRLGYILPNKFLNSQVGEGLREMLAAGKFLEKLVHFEAFQIFQGATTYTCLLFLNKAGNETANIARYQGPIERAEQQCPLPEAAPDLWATSTVNLTNLSAAPWEFTSNLTAKLKQWPGLGTLAQIFQGTGTRADKVYLLEKRGIEGDLVRVYSPEFEREFLLEPTYLKPALRGRSIDRYEISGDLLLIVPYEISGDKGKLIPERILAQNAPKMLEYLKKCKPRLDQRENGRFKGEGWYQYGRPQNLHRFEVAEKIVFPDVASRGTCFLDTGGVWLLDTVYGIAKKVEVQLDLRYLLGILNSPILTYFLKETGTALRGGYFRMKTAYLEPCPIRPIDFTNPADKTRHDQMVALVERMLALHKQLAETKTGHDKTAIQRQITATDGQIDRLVYEMYDLTGEEIKIIEESKR